MHSGRAALLFDGARLRYRCKAAVRGRGRSWGGGGAVGRSQSACIDQYSAAFCGSTPGTGE